MSGRPKTVILNGKIDQNALRTLRLTAADLMEALRGKDVFDPGMSPMRSWRPTAVSRCSAPGKGTGHPRRPWGKGTAAQATIPFVLDGQVLAENLTPAARMLPGWNAPHRPTACFWKRS